MKEKTQPANASRRRHQLRIMVAYLDKLQGNEKSDLFGAVPPVKEILEFWTEEKATSMENWTLLGNILKLVQFSAKYVIPFVSRDDDIDEDDDENRIQDSQTETLENIVGEIFYRLHKRLLLIEKSGKCESSETTVQCMDLLTRALETFVELAEGDMVDFLDLVRFQFASQFKSMHPERKGDVDEFEARTFILRTSQFVVERLHVFAHTTAPITHGNSDNDNERQPVDRMSSLLLKFNFLDSNREFSEDNQEGTLLDTIRFCLQCTHINMRWSMTQLLGAMAMTSEIMCVRIIPLLERLLFFEDTPLRTLSLTLHWEILFIWDKALRHLRLDITAGCVISECDVDDNDDGHMEERTVKPTLLTVLSDFLNGPMIEQQVISTLGICRLLLNDAFIVEDCTEQLISALSLKYCTPSSLAEELVAISTSQPMNNSTRQRRFVSIPSNHIDKKRETTDVETDARTEQTLMQIILTFFQEYHCEKTLHQEELANTVVFIVMDMYDRDLLPFTSEEQHQMASSEEFSVFRSQCILLMSMLQEKYVPMIVESVLNNVDSLMMTGGTERPNGPRVDTQLIRMWILN